MSALCQKCFEGPPDECACTAATRPWEPPSRDLSRKPLVVWDDRSWATGTRLDR